MKLVAAYAICFCLLFGWVGCANRQVQVMRYHPESFTPTNASRIEVFRTRPAARSYTEIGELSLRYKRKETQTALIKLKEKAAELGADALILTGEQSHGAVGVPVGQVQLMIPKRYLYGIAIKYDEVGRSEGESAHLIHYQMCKTTINSLSA